MAVNDPLADMLTQIRNAGKVRLEIINVPFSKLKKGVADILKAEGYINDYQIIIENKQSMLKLNLKYGANNKQAITGIKRISKPGRRIYVKGQEILKVMNGLGVAILSTSKGIVSDYDARQMGVGGEILCEVW